MTKSMKKAIALCLFSMGVVGLMAQSNEFKIDVQKTGAPIQSTMYGIFFEDINYGADGGLYAELIQNRDFEYTPSDREGDKNWNSTHSWSLKGEKATFAIETSDPVHPNNSHYAVLNVDRPGAALTNTGFDGIALKAGEKYHLSLFGRIPEGSKTNKILVRLVDADGTVQGETTVTVSSRSWKTYQAVLTALLQDIWLPKEVYRLKQHTSMLLHIQVKEQSRR